MTQSVPNPPSSPGVYFAQLAEAITGGPVDYEVGQWHVVRFLPDFPQRFLIPGYAEVFPAPRVKRWGVLVPAPPPDAPRSPTGLLLKGF